MRKILPIITFSLVLLISCGKEQRQSINSSVTGSWGYTGADGSFLLLGEQGKVEMRKWDTVLNTPYSRYEVISDSTIKFIKTNNDTVVAKYHLTENNLQLHLSGVCFYNCDEWFGRILSY